jgi:hypothetical protein
LSPAEIYKRAGVTPPVPSGQSGTAVAVSPPLGPVARPPLTKEQGDAQAFASAAALAETKLSPMTEKDIPNVIEAGIAANTKPGWLMSLAKTQIDSPTRRWANSMWQFTNAINRKESGAAITDEEWVTARQLYIPVPGDGPREIADKRLNRINKINSLVTEGWNADQAGGEQFKSDWTAKGVDFTIQPPDVKSKTKTESKTDTTPRAPDANRPANAPPEWDHLSERGKQLWLQQHGGG